MMTDTIVGGGIGGTSCASFVRELFGDKAEIHIFEKSKIGGRLATVNVDGKHYESGGSIIHPKNLYMVEFLEKFNLSKRHVEEGTFGIYDGHQFAFTESQYNFLTVAQMIYRYGLDPYWLQKYIDFLLVHFSEIYQWQRDGYAFSDVHNMLDAMSPKFVEQMRHTLNETMLGDWYSSRFINELVNAVVRVNYGQNVNVHGFVGSVALAGAQPGLWAVHGGNYLVAEHLLDSSNAVLHNCRVTSLIRKSNDDHSVRCVDENNNEETFDEFRAIVIATPITDDLQFVNYQNVKPFLTPYHQLFATFVSGKLSDRFSCSGCPDEILSCNDSLFFNSVGRQHDVNFNASRTKTKPTKVDHTVWKVFSNKPLTETHKKQLFGEIKSVQVVEWFAYPEYENKLSFTADQLRFVLAPNVYHINVIEAAASAMEMSAIGAKNVALLIYNNEMKTLEKIDNKSLSSSHEMGEL